jgi:hypothetical protein
VLVVNNEADEDSWLVEAVQALEDAAQDTDEQHERPPSLSRDQPINPTNWVLVLGFPKGILTPCNTPFLHVLLVGKRGVIQC